MLNIALVAGSGRNNSQSGKVARFIRQRLIHLDHSTDAQSSLIDLGLAPLPLWPAEDAGPWELYRRQLQAADAVVIVRSLRLPDARTACRLIECAPPREPLRSCRVASHPRQTREPP
jgi:hypothetical protein